MAKYYFEVHSCRVVCAILWKVCQSRFLPLTKETISSMQDIPRSTSTQDFERYTITVPVLSSWGTGWQGVVVREFHEPMELESVLLPTVSDIHLVLMTSGAMQFESREAHGSWNAVPIHEGDLFLTPGGGEPYELRWRSLAREPI